MKLAMDERTMIVNALAIAAEQYTKAAAEHEGAGRILDAEDFRSAAGNAMNLSAKLDNATDIMVEV